MKSISNAAEFHSDSCLSAEVPAELAGLRQDQILAALWPEHSRARLQGWIREGRVEINGQVLAVKTRLAAGCQVTLRRPPAQAVVANGAQDLPLDVLYEDAHLLILNKPAGLIVHPGAGRPDGTLLNALLHHRPALDQLPRAGIVHRLDKDTSGLMVVAASLEAHTALVRALQAREIAREYLALVFGRVISGGRVDAPIGRDGRERKRMAVRADGRASVTHYRVAERFADYTLLALRLESGRTHQIRVHMKHIGLPIVGDPVYGRRGDPWRARLGRQALHARRLSFLHPVSGEACQWEAPLPVDFDAILQALRA